MCACVYILKRQCVAYFQSSDDCHVSGGGGRKKFAQPTKNKEREQVFIERKDRQTNTTT